MFKIIWDILEAVADLIIVIYEYPSGCTIWHQIDMRFGKHELRRHINNLENMIRSQNGGAIAFCIKSHYQEANGIFNIIKRGDKINLSEFQAYCKKIEKISVIKDLPCFIN